MEHNQVVGYVRVSTSNQKEYGYSLAEQEREIREYCSTNHFVLSAIYRDEGISGASVDEDSMEIERPGLLALLDRLKQGDIRYIVVLSTSRLWRSDLAKALLVHKLTRLGVDVKAIDRPGYSIRAASPTDMLMSGLLELLDIYEVAEIRQKMHRGRLEKARQGGYSGGRPPFGYRAVRGSRALQICEPEAAAVRRLCELMVLMPDLTGPQLAVWMNEEGYHGRNGSTFNAGLVYRIKRHIPFYLGIYEYAGITAPGQHPPILGNLWQK